MSTNRRLPPPPQAAAASSGCAGCGHPFPLHSNGRTGCLAAGCAGGPATGCESCGGTTVSPRTGRECRRCRGRGTVSSPCHGFAPAGAVPHVPELLAS